jgi:hypothetical protein
MMVAPHASSRPRHVGGGGGGERGGGVGGTGGVFGNGASGGSAGSGGRRGKGGGSEGDGGGDGGDGGGDGRPCTTTLVSVLPALKASVSVTVSPSGSGVRIATMTIVGITSPANKSRKHWQRRLPSPDARGVRRISGGASSSALAPVLIKGDSSGDFCCCLSHWAKGTSSVVRITRPATRVGVSRYSGATTSY